MKNKILIVDDQEINRDILAGILHEDYELVLATARCAWRNCRHLETEWYACCPPPCGASMASHHVAMGEWVSGQIYFKEHLESIGTPNLMKALLDRPDTYYVGQDEQVVYQWLKEHYSVSDRVGCLPADLRDSCRPV